MIEKRSSPFDGLARLEAPRPRRARWALHCGQDCSRARLYSPDDSVGILERLYGLEDPRDC